MFSNEYQNYGKSFCKTKKRRHTKTLGRSVWEPKIKKIKLDSTKINLKLTLKVICTLICCSIFVYESHQLVSLYVSEKTFVENRVERIKFSQLPAITVCLPTFMEMKKWAGYFMNKSDNPEYQKYYQEFIDFENKTMNRTGPLDSDLESFQKQIYSNFQWNAFTKNMEDIPLTDLLEKVSVNVKVRYKIPAIVFNESKVRHKMADPKKIHSLVPYSEPKKCITLFSDFDENFRNIRLDLINMEIQFQHNLIAYPNGKNFNEDLYVSLHSPNMLPDYTRENEFQRLEMGMNNFITYSESKAILLPPPYETKCKNYMLDHSEEQDMRSDCILKCMIDRLEKQFGLTCVWTQDNNKLIRVKNLLNHSAKPLCNHDLDKYEQIKWNITKYQLSIENECHELCPPNCVETYYRYIIEKGNGKNHDEKTKNHFTIHIEHNSFPDLTVEHTPILSWVTLISNLGGLLGMWLEFSFLFFCNLIIDKFIK